jgi:hypothetical protein
MKPMKLVVILVAYYPDRESLVLWSKALQQGVPLRIWDNTPGGCRYKDEFTTLAFMGTGDNLGLGPALQRLLNALRLEGHWDKALYWDQDACWTFASYQWAIALHETLPDDLGCGNKILVGIQGGKVPDSSSSRLVPVRILMTNGMVVPLTESEVLLSSYRPFRMECVDYQLCYKANLIGWVLYAAFGCPDLEHDPTQPSLVWSNGARNFHKRIYPEGRSRQFLLNLAALSLHAASRLKFIYFGVFLRNLLTHLAYRTWFDVVWCLRPSGRQT